MGVKFRLHEKDGTHDRYYIGPVEAPEGMTQKQAEYILGEARFEFQETNPEAMVEGRGWRSITFVEFEDDSIDFTVGDSPRR